MIKNTSLLSKAVAWKQKMSLGNDINISFSLVCGQLKSRIRKNSFEQLLRKSDLKFFPMLINANPKVSDSGAAIKFEFCMLKNTTHADF